MQKHAMTAASRMVRQRLIAGLGLSATIGASILVGLSTEPVVASPGADHRTGPSDRVQDDGRFVELRESSKRNGRDSGVRLSSLASRPAVRMS